MTIILHMVSNIPKFFIMFNPVAYGEGGGGDGDFYPAPPYY